MKLLLSVCLMVLVISSGVAQQKTEAPALSEPGSFTWIVLPDPQSYQKFERNQPVFDLMIHWILDQKEKLNIQMVLCEGDLVDRNTKPEYDIPSKGDQSALNQWKAVSHAFNKLNGKVPYILCTGNHDYGIRSAENRYSQFNSYFPPQGNPLTQSLLIEMAGNEQGVPTLENAVYKWISPAGQKFLLFSLEFAPREAILKWAREVSSRPEYKDFVGVVLTHSYLNSDANRTKTGDYPLVDANYGQAIWEQLIQPSENIQLVFCGHIATSDEHTGQVSYREDVNSAGKPVHQMLFNAQREGGGWHGNGGDGWLRICEFLPDQQTIKVHTFSPLFYISPLTRELSWRRESYDEFPITY